MVVRERGVVVRERGAIVREEVIILPIDSKWLRVYHYNGQSLYNRTVHWGRGSFTTSTSPLDVGL